MRVDGFYVVRHETSGGDAVFLQTCEIGGLPVKQWGVLRFADRYIIFRDAKKAAENAPRQYEGDEPAAVWRVEVTVTKETT